MSKDQKHCEDCGGYLTIPEEECNKCKGKVGTLIPGKEQDPFKKATKAARLTKDEYRIWNECCSLIARSGKWSVQIGDDYYVMVNKKIVITTGSFYPYSMKMILSFKNHEDQVKYIERILKRNGK